MASLWGFHGGKNLPMWDGEQRDEDKAKGILLFQAAPVLGLHLCVMLCVDNSLISYATHVNSKVNRFWGLGDIIADALQFQLREAQL